MPDRALRPTKKHGPHLRRPVLGLNASNARQGIKTQLFPAIALDRHPLGLNASNARQGIKTDSSVANTLDGESV